MAECNVSLRDSLDTWENLLARKHCEGLEIQDVVEFLLDTFTESPVLVGFQKKLSDDRAAIPIQVDIKTQTEDSEEPVSSRLDIEHVWGLNTDKEIRLTLKDVAWADGSHESDWRIRDQHVAHNMSEVIGWVSWVKDQLPPLTIDLLASHHHLYKMPNLQTLCWKFGPVGIPPFQKLSLGQALFGESEKIRWLVRFLRPWRARYPYAHVTASRLIPGSIEEVPVHSEVIAKVIPTMEDAAVKILRGRGIAPTAASPLGWGDPPLGSRTPVTDAVHEGIQQTISKTMTAPTRILMHPNMLSALMKEVTYKGADSSRVASSSFRFLGVEVVGHSMLRDGTILFSNGNNDAFHSVELTDYAPKNRAKLPEASTK